jgi:hypothetical protein
MKQEFVNDVILLGFGSFIFVILLLVLVAAWMQAPSLI